MAAQILVVYSIWPGRSSYSVFVEDCPAAAPGDSSSGRVTVQPPSRRQRGAVSDRPSTCGHLAQPGKRSGAEVPPTTNHPCNHQQGDHRNHLFVAALRGILALPPPHGPGRLAFSAIPGYAAPAMKAVLREAGYGEVWDEGCFRVVSIRTYWTSFGRRPTPAW
ncbi:hypothetical protein Vretimale_12632 [Volvox reticuliferus]|uniref:Uncharacterized protein n=1 Tax=Volvox reticuliferus TaxID=1737510 RepID=A0A8J4GKP7_9CHLO|nr:hypothetical protein Vretimale_12632 [Volvox reticuliferus]